MKYLAKFSRFHDMFNVQHNKTMLTLKTALKASDKITPKQGKMLHKYFGIEKSQVRVPSIC